MLTMVLLYLDLFFLASNLLNLEYLLIQSRYLPYLYICIFLFVHNTTTQHTFSL